MAGWNLFSPTQTYVDVPLADGVSGSAQLSAASGWVFLNGRDIVVPSGSGVVCELPEAARPVYTPLYGLLGRTGGGSNAHFSLSTPGGVITLRQGSAHTTALYFTLSWPQRNRRSI